MYVLQVKHFRLSNSTEVILVNDIEIGFKLTLLTNKIFSCKDSPSKFLGVRLLAVRSILKADPEMFFQF